MPDTSGNTAVATVPKANPVSAPIIKEGEKIVIPNTDEAGEAIQNVLDAYNKFVSAESLYNLKVLKKQGAQDYVTYDLKAMKAKKFDWFKDWAHGTEKVRMWGVGVWGGWGWGWGGGGSVRAERSAASSGRLPKFIRPANTSSLALSSLLSRQIHCRSGMVCERGGGTG